MRVLLILRRAARPVSKDGAPPPPLAAEAPGD